jgi:hypothetical protein
VIYSIQFKFAGEWVEYECRTNLDYLKDKFVHCKTKVKPEAEWRLVDSNNKEVAL